jgi:uncharacterized protein YbjT (DUF2867 family)
MYVVAGVSGNTGKVAAEALLAQQKSVRVVVREESKGAAFRAQGAEVAVASLDDASALTAALQGAEGAYLLLPPQPASNDARADNARRIQAVARAVSASGVRHVVLLSSVGAHHPADTGPILTTHDAEAALSALRTPATFVRAAYFMENWGMSLYALGAGKPPTFLLPDRAIPMVATADIGATAARALLEGPSGASPSIIELSGPRDYSPRDVAAALAGLVKKPVDLEVGPEAVIAGAMKGAGMNDWWAAAFAEMIRGVNSGHVAFEGKGARAVRGAVPIEDVLGRLVAG